MQLPVSQCVEKRRVIFERTSNGTSNQLRFRVILREFRDQHVKAVIDSPALIMDDVIFAADRCPNETLTWERRIRDGISRVPLLTWFCELAVLATVINGQDCGWQIHRRMNPGIAKHLATPYDLLQEAL